MNLRLKPNHIFFWPLALRGELSDGRRDKPPQSRNLRLFLFNKFARRAVPIRGLQAALINICVNTGDELGHAEASNLCRN
jgi:hypothetical protein